MPYPVQGVVSGGAPLTTTGAQNAVNGTTAYLGVNFPNTVTNNQFVGLLAYVVGFTLNGGVNNTEGPNGFPVVANTSNTITLQNPNGVSESANAFLYLFTTNNMGPYGGLGPLGNGPATSNQNPLFVGPGTDYDTGGKSLTARNFFNGWNFVHSEASTQSFLAALTAAKNAGTPWSAVSFTPTAPAQVSQPVPNPPSGSYTQPGSPALTNVTAVTLSGFSPGQTSFVQFTGAYQSK